MDVKWRKSSRSADTGGNCVELGDLRTTIGIRDSKHPNAGHLTVGRAGLAALIDRVKAGDLEP